MVILEIIIVRWIQRIKYKKWILPVVSLPLPPPGPPSKLIICQSTTWTFNDWLEVGWCPLPECKKTKTKKNPYNQIPNYTPSFRTTSNICTCSFLQNWPLNTTRSAHEKQRLVTLAMPSDSHLFLIRGCTLWPRIIFGRVFKRVFNLHALK